MVQPVKVTSAANPAAVLCRGDTTTGDNCRHRTTHPSGLCHDHRHATASEDPSTKALLKAERGYNTPAAMRTALTDRAKQAAKDDPTYDISQRLRQHCYVRFLGRLFDNEPDRWMVKGGGALLARLPDARHTRDIDLWTEGETIEDGIQAINETIEDANTAGNPDHIQMSVGEWTRGERHGRPMARAKITSTIDGKVVSEFGVDMVAGEPSPHPPDEVDAPEPIPVPGLERGRWRIYPADSHTADKVAACFEDYGGERSSRYRDLSDLAHLSWDETFEADRLKRTVNSELANRGLTNPGSFSVPDDASWRRGWRSPKNRAKPLASVPFDTAVARVKSFLDPVLDGSAKGRWDPELGRWTG